MNLATCPNCGNESVPAIHGFSPFHECECGKVFSPNFNEIFGDVKVELLEHKPDDCT